MTEPPDPRSPLAELEAQVGRSIKSAALAVERRLGPIEGALMAYRRALEAEVAREYAAAHSLRFERPAGPTREVAARILSALVAELPELQTLQSAVEEVDLRMGTPAETPEDAAPDPSDAARKALAEVLPHLATELAERTLIVLGALSGRKRELPEPLASRTEWIDTSQGGAHAVGNLPARIRQGRVLGVVICDLAISHKHTEPVLAAARSASVPVGFAGKGGNAGIARALRAIEEQLADHSGNVAQSDERTKRA